LLYDFDRFLAGRAAGAEYFHFPFRRHFLFLRPQSKRLGIASINRVGLTT
jgi:hypothetical protein